jgi:hypothetical protein
MMPFTLGLSLAMLASWVFMPSIGPSMNFIEIYKQRKLKSKNRTADLEANKITSAKV